MSWKELGKDIRELAGPNRYVEGSGNRRARCLVIGEAPGREEIRQGSPFRGRAGRILWRVIKRLGIPDREFYFTNAVKIKLPNYRHPKDREINEWRPILMKETRLVRPEMIVPLGRIALKAARGLPTYPAPHPGAMRWYGGRIWEELLTVFRRVRERLKK